ncbi:penicillin-insensitive murein endopeptidase [Ciceribacter sp. L1K23]|uniref:penicillin-insensitive murein endopeptidase n=1 Tax=Ciceribacter sp. L1K23 TaxID=2820276 RepID=UPI001B846178|nr:penicillin-insensitive murein endopeptidase [Ciceribacter sp. L1K23]MBR0557588.1 penicillin-insensitive murein endopeptidase [Ciceribacter sp. L1K23]
MGVYKTIMTVLLAAASVLASVDASTATEKPAKELFGAVKLPSRSTPETYGFYSKGCISGAVAIPTDGPTWQAMRLSRNRRWGHPQMISLLERLSRDAAQYDGWPGLLLGDISQPRGGPMLSGHASHQVGLDADIWLTPMPSRTLSAKEREDISATSMLKKNTFLTVDPSIWTPAHAAVIMRAASYPEVERIFVNPAIKKKLCETWSGERSALGKVRPYYGHDYHFHVRIKCPADSAGCKEQAAVPAGDGCGKDLAWWFTDEPWAPPKKDPNAKPAPKPKPARLADLPKACARVLDAPGPASEAEVTLGNGFTPTVAAIGAGAVSTFADLPARVPIPMARPSGDE